MPGMTMSADVPAASMGTRTGADQVVPLVEVDNTASLVEHPVSLRQLSHVTNTRPLPSMATDGSAPDRRPPGSRWEVPEAMTTELVQLVPPSVERYALMLPESEKYGAMTVPLGWTTA